MPSLKSPVSHISIRFIPHHEQRYDTLGDWFIEGYTLHIRASNDQDLPPFLIALHELVEAWLCLQRGISQEAVDAFDKAYTGNGEPGDEPDAPYRAEHRQAMLIEHLMANFMGLTDYGTVS